MSDFIIAVGYTASGNVRCWVIDKLEESNCTRKIETLVAEYLQEKGNATNSLRVDEGNSYNCEDCFKRANQANEIAKYMLKFILMHGEELDRRFVLVENQR